MQTITQEMLAYLEECREADKRGQEVRETILQLYDEGARVEEGPLELEIEAKSSQRLSEKSLEKVLGAEGVRELKAAVEPTISRLVLVKRRST